MDAEDENTAMTLQISLMNEDIDDKNALIEEVQAAASGMMKEYGNLEILHTTTKHELESAKSVITTMKVVTAVLAVHISIKSMCVYTCLDTGELLP